MKTICLLMLGCLTAAAQNFAVWFQGTNILGIPTNWPAYVQAIGTNAALPGADVVVTNQDQLNALKAPLFPQYVQGTSLVQSNADFQAAVSAAILQRTNDIESAVSLIQDTNSVARLQRIVVLMTLDQINVLRKTNGMSIITTNQFLAALTNAIRSDPR